MTSHHNLHCPACNAYISVTLSDWEMEYIECPGCETLLESHWDEEPCGSEENPWDNYYASVLLKLSDEIEPIEILHAKFNIDE